MAHDKEKCEEIEKQARDLNQRVGHLESAKYSYENTKGKGRFDKDNPVASKLLDTLLLQKVALAAKRASMPAPEEDNPEGIARSLSVPVY